MAPWGWDKGRKKYFSFPNILLKKYLYLSTLLNSNKKTFGVNIDFGLVCYCTKTIFKLQLESIWMINCYFAIYLGNRNIALSFHIGRL
jgi:hypothetical protein